MAETIYSPSMGGTIICFRGLNNSVSKARFKFGTGPRFSPVRKAMPEVIAYEAKTMLSPVAQSFGKELRFVMPKSRKLPMLIIS